MKIKRKQAKPKSEKKVRVIKRKKISKDETMHAAPPTKGLAKRPGHFIIDALAKSNPNVERVRDMLRRLPREDIENRIAWIYCTILGLCNMEGQ